MTSVFAIKLEDALDWHDATQHIAGIAQRSGFSVRVVNGRWRVWATNRDFHALKSQEVQS